MQLQIRDNLPFVTIELIHAGKSIEIPNILVDTGSGGTIFAADVVANVGIVPQAEDVLHTIHGVGGSEVVFMRKINQLKAENFVLSDFEIEVGGMDYGFDISGILGMDFLLTARAPIDLKRLRIDFQ